MRVTLLADEQPIAHAELRFRLTARDRPDSVATGPAELLPAFEGMRNVLVPPTSRALVPFRASGHSSAPIGAARGSAPTLALEDVRGSRLPTRAVHCVPAGTSPSGFTVLATFDEAAGPLRAFTRPPPWEAGGDADWPDA